MAESEQQVGPRTYRAVVKYALDASDNEKRRALEQGIEECALELVAEHGLEIGQVEATLEEAQSAAEYEIQLRRERDDA